MFLNNVRPRHEQKKSYLVQQFSHYVFIDCAPDNYNDTVECIQYLHKGTPYLAPFRRLVFSDWSALFS